jgi:hypothetical protein
MSDTPIFKQRIVIKPSGLEFWPSTGWHVTGRGWQRLYSCRDRNIVRRAIVEPRGSGWAFRVSEVTRYGVIAVAIQPSSEFASQPSLCWHAADLAALNVYRSERSAI